jgi:hypothetical protein
MSLSRITSASIANSAISAADIADGTITAAKIISVANTQITGNIVSSQIADGTITAAKIISVANTQITGNIVSSQIAPSIVLTTPALGTPASGVLTNCTGVAAAALPAGTVLQVVSFASSNTTSTSLSTYQPTALTASITPKFATSKIYIMVSGQVDSTVSATQVNVTVFKNGVNLVGSAGFTSLYSSASRIIGNESLSYLDSPATTSATTYAVYFLSGSSTGPVVFNFSNSTGSITLMEIAG